MNSSAHTHYNKILSNVSIEYKNDEHIAEKILPRQKVENESDLYYVFDKSTFNIPEDLRADGTKENESTGGWIERNYQVINYGLRDRITKRMKQNADKGLDLEISVTNRLTEQLRNGLENRVVGPTGLIRQTANNVGTSNPDLTTTSASPRKVVLDACTAIQSASGKMPNILVCNPNILRKITLTAEYREEVKFTKDIRNLDMPDQLYGLKVIQATSLYNSAAKGLAPNLNYLMDNDIWIGYVKPGGLGFRDLTYGTLFYTEQYTRKWYDEDVEVDLIAVNDLYDPRLIAKECGYLVTAPFG
jgi:hypothetical protein